MTYVWLTILTITPSLPGFSGSEDCIALEQLLQGYDEQDEDQVHRVCNSPLFKYMDNDVSVVPRAYYVTNVYFKACHHNVWVSTLKIGVQGCV
jgi:hypothetical protein